MNAEIRFKDKRILEALEYIDEKYIDDVFNVLKEPDMTQNAQAKLSPFRRWRQYLALAACLILLAFATPIFGYIAEFIGSFAAGIGDRNAQNEEDIELCLANVDYSIFTPGFIDEINAAWKEYRGDDDVMFENLEALKYQSHSRYLGTYNGYLIFTYDLTKNIHGYESFCYVANLGLRTVEAFAYKDAKFVTLGELYESGNISYLDLCKIFDKSYEMLDYYQITRETDERITLTIPQMPELKLSERAEKKILEALKPYLPNIHNTDFTDYKAYITDYYGCYNGAYVFKYKSPEITYNFSFDDYYYESVADINFLYRYSPVNRPYSFDNIGSGTRIYVYYDGEIISLSYAYIKGILTYDDIKTIKNYHTMYFPYMIDEFLEDEKYITKLN